MIAPSETRGTSGDTPHGEVFARFAIRSLRLNRTRTVVSTLGIMLSCALITAIFTSVVSLYDGLLKAETMMNGTWQVELVNITEEGRGRLGADSRVERSYMREMHGSALMPESFEGYYGRYLDVHEWPTADKVGRLKPLPHIVEGRAPESPDEIVLTLDLKGLTVADGTHLYETLPTTGRDDDAPRAAWEGELGVGSSIELALGQRSFIDDETGWEYPCLYNESLYTKDEGEGDVLSEYLSDIGPARDYTVVGFYAPEDNRADDVWNSEGCSFLGFTRGSDLPVRSTSAYLTTNLRSRADIDRLIIDYTGVSHAVLNSGGNRGDGEYMGSQTIAYAHDSLLRYQGMLDDRAIWGTLYSLAAILACVVAIASVSLIYNSFAIAVSERTRQFGLLASLGASKRQLRRVVYTEALLLSAIGIPSGILAGLAGTYAVFNIAGEGIGMLIDREAFSGVGMSSVAINSVVLVASAALALVTVLVSASVPAWRASRVSAVGAIRQTSDVVISRRERRTDRRGGPIGPAMDRLRLHLLGVPGLIAHRNLTRAKAKGRVAVASLAVSVSLIIISGGISHYLGLLTEVAKSDDCDIVVSLDHALGDEEDTADGIESIEALYRRLADVEGARGEGWMLDASLYGSFEDGVLDTDELFKAKDGYDMPDCAVGPDGTTYAPILLIFVDDETWLEMIEDNRLDEAEYTDPDNPLALAVNGARSSDGGKYTIRDLFEGNGDVTLFTNVEAPGTDTFSSCAIGADGAPLARFEGYGPQDEQILDANGQALYRNYEKPLADVLHDTYELPIGAIVESVPASVPLDGSAWPTLVLPTGALPTLARTSEDLDADAVNGNFATPFAFHTGAGSFHTTLYARLSFSVVDPREAEAEMNAVLTDALSGAESYNSSLVNNADQVRTSRLMFEAVQLFINCFIAVTTAIAVANVFNTITSSLVLRRREFAALRSAGMGNRAFLRMIALECLSYAWRGLALGLALGAIVTYLMYRATELSYAGLVLVVPLGWVIAAIGVVLGALVISTAYALGKSSMGSTGSDSGSIVQTLREDAI